MNSIPPQLVSEFPVRIDLSDNPAVLDVADTPAAEHVADSGYCLAEYTKGEDGGLSVTAIHLPKQAGPATLSDAMETPPKGKMPMAPAEDEENEAPDDETIEE
jgi:hypothetical protein